MTRPWQSIHQFLSPSKRLLSFLPLLMSKFPLFRTFLPTKIFSLTWSKGPPRQFPSPSKMLHLLLPQTVRNLLHSSSLLLSSQILFPTFLQLQKLPAPLPLKNIFSTPPHDRSTSPSKFFPPKTSFPKF